MTGGGVFRMEYWTGPVLYGRQHGFPVAYAGVGLGRAIFGHGESMEAAIDDRERQVAALLKDDAPRERAA